MNGLIEYVANLKITQGRLAGERFRPLPWQKSFMRGAFGPNVATAALSVGRGNGKTALLSGIACATLDGPLAVPRGETLIVASTFEQARIAFEHVVAFMGVRIFRDKARWRVWDTAQGARVEDRLTGARVRVLGSDPRRAHGLAPCLILADEPTQWDPNKSDRMLAALRTAAGKQPSAPTHSECSRRYEIYKCFQTPGVCSGESFVCVCALVAASSRSVPGPRWRNTGSPGCSRAARTIRSATRLMPRTILLWARLGGRLTRHFPGCPI